MNKLRPIWESYAALWVHLIREGQRSGAFRKDMNARVAAFGILGMCNWVSRWYNPKKCVAVRELVDTYSILVLQGIGREGAGARRAR